MNPNVREQPICIPGMDDRHRVGAGAFTSPLEAHTREGAQRVEESPVSDAAPRARREGPLGHGVTNLHDDSRNELGGANDRIVRARRADGEGKDWDQAGAVD